MNLTPKTASAGAAGGLGGSIAVVVISILTASHFTVSPELASAITAIVTALASFAGSYFAPRSDPTPEQVATILQAQPTNTTQNKP